MPISPGGTKYDNDELDALFKAVGFVVVQWGQAEQSLEMIVAMLYQNLGGKPLVKRIPVLLTPKLEFVQKCLATIPKLQRFKTEGDALVQNFEELSKKRHDLIHGAIASLSMEQGGFQFAKLDVKDGFHVLREFRFESAEFPKLTKELIDLGAAATSLARKLWECVEKPHGKRSRFPINQTSEAHAEEVVDHARITTGSPLGATLGVVLALLGLAVTILFLCVLRDP